MGDIERLSEANLAILHTVRSVSMDFGTTGMRLAASTAIQCLIHEQKRGQKETTKGRAGACA